MPLHLLSSDQLRTYCRQRLESLELWLRRLVHDEFTAAYGPNYAHSAVMNGQPIFNSRIRTHMSARKTESTTRPVDALLLDDISSVVCKDDVYRKHFASALVHGFPHGKDHLRLMLKRLVSIRNALSHANPISVHDAERVLCYSSDIVSSLIHHYAAKGMTKDFDAPVFTRYSDSLGNVETPIQTDAQLDFTRKQSLRCGGSIRIEVEVDSHYAPETYDISWLVTGVPDGETGVGNSFALTLLPKHANEHLCIFATLMARKREWHRHGRHDARLVLVYRVLPPI